MRDAVAGLWKDWNDVEDVTTLLAVQGAAIDLDRIRQVLALLEAALGQSDLLPAFAHALKRSRSSSL